MIGGFCMAGQKGMRQYPEAMRELIRQEYESGASINGLSKKYNISRWSIYCLCGLTKDKDPMSIKRKGRPHKSPPSSEERIKELERENDLLRSFLAAAGRRRNQV